MICTHLVAVELAELAVCVLVKFVEVVLAKLETVTTWPWIVAVGVRVIKGVDVSSVGSVAVSNVGPCSVENDVEIDGNTFVSL